MSTVFEENGIIKSNALNSNSRGICGKQKGRLPVVDISAKDDLICSFNFIVTLNQYKFGFASVSGISMEREVDFIKEGGVNDHQLMVGCPQGSGGYKLDFTRGLMLHEPAFPFNFAEAAAAAVIGNSMARKAALMALAMANPQQTLEKGPAIGTIQVYDRQNKLKAMYSFLSLGMTSWSGGDLTADSSGILIESISIVHTGLIRVPLTLPSVPYVGTKSDNETQRLREEFLKKTKGKLRELKEKKEAEKKEAEEKFENLRKKVKEISDKIKEARNSDEAKAAAAKLKAEYEERVKKAKEANEHDKNQREELKDKAEERKKAAEEAEKAKNTPEALEKAAQEKKEAKEKEKARLDEIKARQDAAKSRAEKANKANEEAKQARQKAQEQTDSGTTESQ